eukprot:TRINITY_DN2987_c0_g1_i1.p1 TRINITY_DN2987_c0_g1~~TRINITY_DN2987_c0_g1_i1.p1  ORF type:complete len:273 (-),score=95.95 TRINITY_DN2987_c0_g1_i1:31-810(-)
MAMNDPNLFQNMKTVIVTGATSGLGLELAISLVNEGKKVIGTGRRKETFSDLEKKGIIPYFCDVASKQSCEEFVKKMIEEHPDVDTLINNAGIQKELHFDQEDVEESVWDEEISININGLIRLTQLFLPHFKKLPHATIMTVSSGLGLHPAARFPIYSATKAFVHSYTRSLRHQLSKTNIKVVEIIPPAVHSNLNPQFRAKPEAIQFLAKAAMDTKEYNDKVVQKLKDGELEFGIGMAGQNLDAVKEREYQIFKAMNSF